MTDLGTLGDTHSHAYALNALGHVTGISDIVGNAAEHAFLYADGQMKNLSTLGGSTHAALASNRRTRWSA